MYNHVTHQLVCQLLGQWHGGSGASPGLGLPAGAPAGPGDWQQHGSSGAAGASTSGATSAVVVQLEVDAVRFAMFGPLFAWLLRERGVLCLALYRPVTHLGQAFSCVLTNPAADTQLVPGDRAVVLQPLLPGQGLPGDVCGLEGPAAGGARAGCGPPYGGADAVEQHIAAVW